MTLRPLDFESSASAYSATLANWLVRTEKFTRSCHHHTRPNWATIDFFSEVASDKLRKWPVPAAWWYLPPGGNPLGRVALASARNHKFLPVDEHSPCLSLLLLSSAFQGFSVFRTKRFETQRKGGKERYGRNLRFVALAPVFEAIDYFGVR